MPVTKIYRRERGRGREGEGREKKMDRRWKRERGEVGREGRGREKRGRTE